MSRPRPDAPKPHVQAIRRLMATKGYNMSSLAEELHIGRQAVQRLMRGHDCKLSTLERIAVVLDADLSDIFSATKGSTGGIGHTLEQIQNAVWTYLDANPNIDAEKMFGVLGGYWLGTRKARQSS